MEPKFRIKPVAEIWLEIEKNKYSGILVLDTKTSSLARKGRRKWNLGELKENF